MECPLFFGGNHFFVGIGGCPVFIYKAKWIMERGIFFRSRCHNLFDSDRNPGNIGRFFYYKICKKKIFDKT